MLRSRFGARRLQIQQTPDIRGKDSFFQREVQGNGSEPPQPSGSCCLR